MATPFKLYHVAKEDLYVNQSPEDKEEIRFQMVKMALKEGYKPTARYFNTYPATVRRWVRRYQECGWDGLHERRK